MLGSPFFPWPHRTPLTFASAKGQIRKASAIPGSQISQGEFCVCVIQVYVFHFLNLVMTLHTQKTSPVTSNVALFCSVIMLGIFCLLLNSWDFRSSWLIRCVFSTFPPDALLLCRNNPSVEWAGSKWQKSCSDATVVIRNLFKKIKSKQFWLIVLFPNIISCNVLISIPRQSSWLTNF